MPCSRHGRGSSESEQIDAQWSTEYGKQGGMKARSSGWRVGKVSGYRMRAWRDVLGDEMVDARAPRLVILCRWGRDSFQSAASREIGLQIEVCDSGGSLAQGISRVFGAGARATASQEFDVPAPHCIVFAQNDCERQWTQYGERGRLQRRCHRKVVAWALHGSLFSAGINRR